MRLITISTEYNVIAVFNCTGERILMCKRRKNPYQGLFNLVGGKIESNEDGFHAAYRELEEETGILSNDIQLMHFMDFTYYLTDIKVEVYVGCLLHEVHVHGDENELVWVEGNENFFDTSKFAGEGNIGHIMKNVALFKETISNRHERIIEK